MRRLSKLVFLLIAVIMVLNVFLPTISFAILVPDEYSEETDHVQLDISNTRTSKDWTEHSGEVEYGFFANDADQIAYKIGEKSGGSLSFDDLYYCIKWGIGFGSSESTYVVPEGGVTYNYEGNLKDASYTFSNVNKARWIADNMYVPNAEGAAAIKDKLLTRAGITQSKLTDADIDVVQQFALWYFASNEYDLNYILSRTDFNLGKALLTLDGEYFDPNDETQNTRAEQIQQLFLYFINNDGNLAPRATIEFDDSVTSSIITDNAEAEDYILVGPFKLDSNNDNYFDFSYEFKYKSEASGEYTTLPVGSYVIVNEDIQTMTTDFLNNGEFYVAIPKDEIPEVTNFTINVDYSYYNTVATVWRAGDDSQPVLKVEKVKVEDSDEATVGVTPKEFDLSLRKFISSITRNGQNVQIEDRTPLLYTSTLKNGATNDEGETEYTATYKHKKNTLQVKRGDRIVYTIRVYNEGEKSGQATLVVDKILDSNLKFVESSTINTSYGWTRDGQTYKTSYLSGKNIPAYDREDNNGRQASGDLKWQNAEDGADGLYYRELKIEFEVDDNVESGITLTNIAEIKSDNDGHDRDSTPGNVNETNYDFTRLDENDYGTNSMYQEDDDDFERVVVDEREIFDLALRKYITGVTDATGETSLTIDSRNPSYGGLDELASGERTTAEYKHRKDPLDVEEGDIITYQITVYNEGSQAGRAITIIDQLPTGLEFVEVVSGDFTSEYDRNTNTVTLNNSGTNNLNAFDGSRLDSTTIVLKCRVVASEKKVDQVLTNIAWISYEYNAETETYIDRDEHLDRDSEPATAPDDYDADDLNTTDIGYTGKDTYTTEESLANSNKHYEGQQDDDDFEKVVVRGKVYFDLSLRKYISDVERRGSNVEFDARIPQVDTTPLENGDKTTSNYIHNKTPLTVKQGDIITYKIRVYNEADIDGYATEITDYLPAGLGFLQGYSKNFDNQWSLGDQDVESRPLVGEENGWYKSASEVPTTGILAEEDLENIIIVYGKNDTTLKLTTEALKNELITKYTEGATTLDYKEVELTCIVLAPNTYNGTLKNIAEISQEAAAENVTDRDSHVNSVFDDEVHHPGDEIDGYTPGEEDDDDFEPIQLQYFDLALRKFIDKVNDKKLTGNQSREPRFKEENGKYTYVYGINPEKDPVEVVDKDLVTYTIRVFNEGTISGYAEEIEDDIPEGLVFVPDNKTNTTYGWKMYYRDENNNLVETDDVEKATVIRTDYLSEAKGTIVDGVNSNLIKLFNKTTMNSPDYKDVQVVFKVAQDEIPENNINRIVTNKAHITEDSDFDEDSTPDEWLENDDDQDIENIYVKEFDLALYKWVTQTVVTVDGKTTTTETGFEPNVGHTEGSEKDYRSNDAAEPIAKVEVDRKKINSTVVKFVYNIKVVNEGDIPGYATEITDYIPEGLEFIEEDNSSFWKIGEKDGTIVSRALETVLLEPNESVVIPVVFTWKNDANNLGIKTNIAAITEDYNDSHVKDIDSTVGNEDVDNYKTEQEDDDDFALVMLALKTGTEVRYIGIIFGFMVVIAAGIILIKKYVL